MLVVKDSLYDEVQLRSEVVQLAQTPAVQRLRRVRLSNIDSVSLPAIAGLSRFEHVIGTASLAHNIGFWEQIDADDQLVLAAAALLHDIAITPFGHLLEEALSYADLSFSHEKKMVSLFREAGAEELGGIDLQIYCGAQAGIRPWARKTFQGSFEDRLTEILEAVCGNGKWGQYISSDIDLDNIDNVCRLALHLGIPFRRDLPVQLAQSLSIDTAGSQCWYDAAPALVEEWLHLRHLLYSNLMLARKDFAGKAMLTSAILRALRNGQLGASGLEWTLVDDDLIAAMTSPTNKGRDIAESRLSAETVRRWHLGDLWSSTPLWWVDGDTPSKSKIWRFGDVCADALGRECVAHGITDKRHRTVTIRLVNGTQHQLGQTSKRWLLGVLSPVRKDFTVRESRTVEALAAEYFAGELVGVDVDMAMSSFAGSLFGAD